MNIQIEKLFQKLGEQLVTIQLLQEQVASLQAELAEVKRPPVRLPDTPDRGLHE